MNILLLGSGGREYTLAWKLGQSPLCHALYIAPGNGGTEQFGENVDLDAGDFEAVKDFCLEHNINLVVVGPEAPLVDGIADAFLIDPQVRHIHLVGPTRHAAQLEGSKAFAKAFMGRHGIPTAAYRAFGKEDLAEGLAYLEAGSFPVVLKADGLAAGKGVLICNTYAEAASELEQMLKGKFGDAGNTVVIEEFLDGIEFSVFVLTDGKTAKLLPIAKDYKRIGEGDSGLNTGGMGSVSPVPFVNETLMEKVIARIINPTMAGIREENMNYKGFIFFGLISVKGEPYVIEYNCRMGDPETQVVMPRLENDLLELLMSIFDGSLEAQNIEESTKYATAVVLASAGYPGNYEKGKPIGLPERSEETLIIHAGTRRDSGQLVTAGGRVLAAVGKGDSMQAALAKSNALAGAISFDGKYFRSDIGFDL